jgi:uncharacterized membrane protein YoaK (UPF0700 family)
MTSVLNGSGGGPVSDRALAAWLAIIAGYVDACGLRAFGTYVSFMSGNTTQAGMAIGRQNPAAAMPFVLAILCFVGGSFTGTWLTHSSCRRRRQVLLGLTAGLLFVTFELMHSGKIDGELGIATLGTAMGMMNTTLSEIGRETVSLTFVTGNLSRLGRHLALAVSRVPLAEPKGPRDSHLRRAFVLAAVWLAVFAGALVSEVISKPLGTWILLPPTLILSVLASFSTQSPDVTA